MDREAWQVTVHGVTRVEHDLATKHHHHQNKFKMVSGTSLAVQWLRLCISNEGDMGSVPGWGTKIPQAVRHGKKKKKKELLPSRRVISLVA